LGLKSGESQEKYTVLKNLLKGGVAGLSIMLAFPAFSEAAPLTQETGQTSTNDEDDEGLEEIVVRGIRRSAVSAQSIKRDSDTFVDAVTAQDIGALSDRSIAEALQRVPGVSVSNFSGPNDPDRFSPEGSGVVIRGLGFTRSEVNGRDIFTTGIGRAIDFQAFPSELVSAIEVYKNNSADQIEGGIAGTVNLVTRKPFDNDGFVIAGSVDFNYSDLQDIQDITPGGSLLISDRWETNIGEFGLLASGSFSRLVNETNGTQIAVAELTPEGSTQPLIDENFVGTPFSEIFPNIQNVFGGALPNAIPDSQFGFVGGGIRNEGRERERYGIDVSGQWRSPDKRTTVTLEYLRSDASLETEENVVQTNRNLFNRSADPEGLFPATGGTGGVAVPFDPAGEVINQIPVFANGGFNFPSSADGIIPQVPEGGTFLELDQNGLFQAGVLTTAGSSFRGSGLPGTFDDFLTSVQVAGILGSPQESRNRGRFEDSNVENYTFNIQHEFNSRFRAQFDAQYVRSNNQVFDQTATFGFFANTFLDLNDGNAPSVLFLPSNNPIAGQTAILPDSEGNFTPEQQAAIAAFGTNPDNFFFESLLSFAEDSDTEEVAFAADYEYDIDAGWFSGLKFGSRFSERDQIARATVFDFSFVNVPFGSSPPFPVSDIPGLGADAGIPAEELVEAFDFTGLQRGAVTNPGTILTAGDFFRSNGDVSGSPLQGIVDQISSANNLGPGNNNTLTFQTLGNRGAESGVFDLIPGTPFRAGEISETTEEIWSAYVRGDFDTGPISGNIGVRWVRTEVTTTGSQTQAFITPVTAADLQSTVDADGNTVAPLVEPDTVIGTPLQCAELTGGAGSFDPGNGIAPIDLQNAQESALCNLSIQEQIDVVTFFDGSTQPLTTRNRSNLFLPSLNLKYNIDDDKLIRFAASRTIFRPDFGAFRNNQFVSQDTDPATNAFRIRADGGNAFLDPVTSINLDLSFEWYFAEAGSFTIAGFWKDLDNVIIQGETAGPPLSANGVTFENTEIIGPANVADGRIQGFEVSYRQFYDFLPGILGNLGFEGSYTFVDQSAIPITQPVANSLGGDAVPGDVDLQQTPTTNIFPITDLEGLSRHTFNVAGIYEDDLFSLRLVYNWRSRFLLTQRDVGTPFPGLPVFNESVGSLDASVFVNITENLKLGIQAVNLTNRTLETTQQINAAGDVAPRSFFINDRRFAAALRFNF
jgi:TonB-dependent receptor